MGKRLSYTPRSKIRAALRRLWLHSRERQAAIKRDNYSCVECGVKQSRAKGKEVYVEVHHKSGVGNWSELIKAVYEHLLCSADDLETLCKECHRQKGE